MISMEKANEAKQAISADVPLTSPGDDRLGYAPFAEIVAKSITVVDGTHCVVMAIYGKWGTGKSTVLNFVEHYLRKNRGKAAPLVLRFNPWWFSGDEDLVKQFFRQLRVRLDAWKVFSEDLKNDISDLGESLSEIPWFQIGNIGKLLKLLSRKTPDITALKESIQEKLLAKRQRIVVIIDDIDRLTAEEIRQLFRLVKAVADFPYVVYVLAFDRDVVADALKEVQRGDGETYLEKIVQVPFDLPLPDETSLRRMLFEKLDALLAGNPEEEFDRERWETVFWDGVTHFIRTPRSVVRLTNALSATYPVVRNEVNSVDFIGIETIRVWYPWLYDLIRNHPDTFTGSFEAVSRYGDREKDRLKPFHDEWLSKIKKEDAKAVRNLMIELFPKLDAIFGNTHHSEDDWAHRLRVCSPKIFPIYFRPAYPAGAVSNEEVQTLLGLANEPDILVERLITLTTQKRPDGTTRARAFLERLENYTADIPKEKISPLVKTLLKVADQLTPPEDEPRGIFDFDNDLRITRVIFQLLRRVDQQQRLEVMKEAIKESSSLAMIAGEVRTWRQEFEKKHKKGDANDPPFFTENQVRELEEIALAKVRAAAKDGSLETVRKLHEVLFGWKEWCGDVKEVRDWVARYVSTSQNLATFLQRFSQKTFSTSMDSGYQREKLRLHPRWVAPFVHPDSIIERIRLLVDDKSISEEQRAAARQFVKEYEMQKRGLDPDNPLAERELERSETSG